MFRNKLKWLPILILALAGCFATVNQQAQEIEARPIEPPNSNGDTEARSIETPNSNSETEATPEPLINIPIVSNLPLVTPKGSNRTFYISPDGNDSLGGTSANQAWRTFNHAWSILLPGDTLILLDGTYTPGNTGTIVPNVRNGEPGKPITIRARNDGKAIIDGQGRSIPVSLGREGNGWSIAKYFVFEGIVAQNSSESVYFIQGNHNVFRRASGYDANTDGNNHVFWVWGSYNLLEDCVASGTGRKMILLFEGEKNTVRRCLADWRQWDGRNYEDDWPWGENIEIYNANNNIIENSIGNGNTPRASISLLTQDGDPLDGKSSSGNKILGTMSIRSGMQADGTPMVWGTTRPQPTQYSDNVADVFGWAQYMSGFTFTVGGGAGYDNLWQDILSWGNARYGLDGYEAGNARYGNNRINRATVFNNGLNNVHPYWGGIGVGSKESSLQMYSSIENSYIENILTDSGLRTQTGEGARLTNRYVDGVLTDEPLWPWPMEDRVQAELGYSVTQLMQGIIAASP